MTNRDIDVRTSPHRRTARPHFSLPVFHTIVRMGSSGQCVCVGMAPGRALFASACRFAESNNSRHLILMSDGVTPALVYGYYKGRE